MKNSFSIFELILTIIISSIITIYSMIFIKELYFENEDLQSIESQKLDLISTKIFLQKQKELEKNLKLDDHTLYFKESVLLENVYQYSLKKDGNSIIITLNLNNMITQTWKFKK